MELKGAQLESACLSGKKLTKRSKLAAEQPRTNATKSLAQMALLYLCVHLFKCVRSLCADISL